MTSQHARKTLVAAAAVALLAVALATACGGEEARPAPTSLRVTPAATLLGDEAGGTASPTESGGGAGGQSQAAATISIESTSADVGAEATVELQAVGVTEPGLGAWTMDVVFDPAVVSVVECAGTPPPSVCNPEWSERAVRVAGATATGLQGDATLATITFRCEAAGTSPLEITVDVLADATIGAPQDITAEIEGGEISCG